MTAEKDQVSAEGNRTDENFERIGDERIGSFAHGRPDESEEAGKDSENDEAFAGRSEWEERATVAGDTRVAARQQLQAKPSGGGSTEDGNPHDDEELIDTSVFLRGQAAVPEVGFENAGGASY